MTITKSCRSGTGSFTSMESHLQMPDQLSCSIDQATGTGKSYVLYGVAAILLAGKARLIESLVLCPSNTIENGLQVKFRELASNSDLGIPYPQTRCFQLLGSSMRQKALSKAQFALRTITRFLRR